MKNGTYRFGRQEEVIVGVIERPRSSLGDFYRGMGPLFGVNLSPANRYGEVKDLGERWRSHIKNHKDCVDLKGRSQSCVREARSYV